MTSVTVSTKTARFTIDGPDSAKILYAFLDKFDGDGTIEYTQKRNFKISDISITVEYIGSIPPILMDIMTFIQEQSIRAAPTIHSEPPPQLEQENIALTWVDEKESIESRMKQPMVPIAKKIQQPQKLAKQTIIIDDELHDDNKERRQQIINCCNTGAFVVAHNIVTTADPSLTLKRIVCMSVGELRDYAANLCREISDYLIVKIWEKYITNSQTFDNTIKEVPKDCRLYITKYDSFDIRPLEMKDVASKLRKAKHNRQHGVIRSVVLSEGCFYIIVKNNISDDDVKTIITRTAVNSRTRVHR